jgi:hypothetical protein
VPWNVLLLPLLAGYLYCTECDKVRFKYRQVDGYRLLLASALYGFLFLVLATVAVVVVGLLAIRIAWLRETTLFWISHNPYPHLGKSGASLILSYFVTKALNRFFLDEDHEQYKVLVDENAAFELLLQRAVAGTHPLLLSLKNQKAYVVLSLDSVRIDRKYLSVLPLWSGYRNKDTQEVTFTVNYSKVYQQLVEKRKNGLEPPDRIEDSFELVVPADLVASATLFDMHLYSEHFSAEDESSAPAPSPNPPAKS